MMELIKDPDPEFLGPAMLALTPKQRRFVIGWIEEGGKGKGSKVAQAAGYSPKGGANRVKSHHNLRNPKVIAAIREEAEKRFQGPVVVKALLRLGELVESEDEKISASATDSVLDRAGYSRRTQQDVRVEHTDNRGTAELLKAIENIRQRALPVIETTAVDVKD